MLPCRSATISDPAPENSPLTVTICAALLLESFLVQLFSSPQQAQAASTSSAPGENENRAVPSSERTRLASVISAIAIQSRPETFSEKRIIAKIAVATISKLPSSEAVSAAVVFKPSMSKIGARISSAIIAIVYGSSCLVSG